MNQFQNTRWNIKTRQISQIFTNSSKFNIRYIRLISFLFLQAKIYIISLSSETSLNHWVMGRVDQTQKCNANINTKRWIYPCNGGFIHYKCTPYQIFFPFFYSAEMVTRFLSHVDGEDARFGIVGCVCASWWVWEPLGILCPVNGCVFVFVVWVCTTCYAHKTCILLHESILSLVCLEWLFK